MTFDEYPLHDSQRGWFGRALYFEMQANPNILLLTGDLGFAMFDRHRDDFPNQFVNTGAAEQAMIGAGIGCSLSGRIPICYSITTFLLFRSFEWHRNYLQHEGIPVLLVGSGLDNDYAHDGITHQSHDARDVLKLFPRIRTYFPDDKQAIPAMLRTMIKAKEPAFLCLRR